MTAYRSSVLVLFRRGWASGSAIWMRGFNFLGNHRRGGRRRHRPRRWRAGFPIGAGDVLQARR